MSSWDYLTKFIIVGSASVGKSSLLVRLTDDRFLVNPETTIGIEFGSHVVHIQETGERVKLNVWDTAGSETFRSITRSYYRGAAGALLVYSVVDRDTFIKIGDWLRDIRQHAEENVSIILVGNKVDLCEGDVPEEEGKSGSSNDKRRSIEISSGRKRRRQVSIKEAEAFAKQEGLLFVEASAKTGENVEEAFKRAARHIHANFQANRTELSNRSGLMSDNGRATIVPTSVNNQVAPARNCCIIA